jgi:predicted RNA binding protein YcfA (HicA-like mRNA interferase family)
VGVNPRDLPLAPGERHVKAFCRDGWEVARRQGSHAILEKPGVQPILSIPCHPRDLSRTLLARQVELAGLSAEKYHALFKGKRAAVKDG